MTTSVSNTRLTRMKMVTTHMISIVICTLITRSYWLQNRIFIFVLAIQIRVYIRFHLRKLYTYAFNAIWNIIFSHRRCALFYIMNTRVWQWAPTTTVSVNTRFTGSLFITLNIYSSNLRLAFFGTTTTYWKKKKSWEIKIIMISKWYKYF